MAYKDIAYSSGSAPGGSIVMNMPASAAAGDRAYAVISQDVTGKTFSVPSGWDPTPLVVANQATPDSQSCSVFEKKALSGSEGATQTFTSSGTNDWHGFIVCFSGRHATAAVTFASTPTQSTTSSTTTPQTHSGITTGTAAAGDDLLFVDTEDKQSSTDTWSHSNWSNSFVERDDRMFSWCNTGIATLDNVGAGAFGNVSVDITNSGSNGTGWSAFVIAIPAAGGGGTTSLPPQRAFPYPILNF